MVGFIIDIYVQLVKMCIIMSYVQIVVLGNQKYWFETTMIAIHVAMKISILTTSQHFNNITYIMN
jgi:hypothetical protein